MALLLALGLPLLAGLVWWFWPLPELPRVSDTWQVGCPELDVEWDVYPAQQGQFDQWISGDRVVLTAAGPYLASTQTGVPLERYDGGTLAASMPASTFEAFTVATDAEGQTLVAFGHDQGHIQLRRYDATSLAHLDTTPMPEAIVPSAVVRGVDLAPLTDGRWLLLLQPKSKQRDVTLFTLVWDPTLGSFSTPQPTAISAPLPDWPFSHPRLRQAVELTWVEGDRVLRLRPDEAGKCIYGLLEVRTGTSRPDPLQDIDSDALFAAVKQKERAQNTPGGTSVRLHEPQLMLHQEVVLPEWYYGFPDALAPDPRCLWPMAQSMRLAFRSAPDRIGLIERLYATIGDLTLTSPEHPQSLALTDPSLIEAARTSVLLRGSGIPLTVVGFSPNQALILQRVMQPPATLNGGAPILRLGLLDVATGQLTWHGWVDFPILGDSPTDITADWRVAVFDEQLVVSCTIQQVAMEPTPPREVAAIIALPAELRSPWWGDLEATW